MHRGTRSPWLVIALAFVSFVLPSQARGDEPTLGSVIFIHPDGAGINAWAAARMALVGPDNDLAWDKLPNVALYRGHLLDALTSSSNGGGTVHAFGRKVQHKSFGKDGTTPITSASGFSGSIASEALAAGLRVGIINSASVFDAGTGVFLASVDNRRSYAEIARLMLEAKPHVMLGGGEAYFIPKGATGRHGPSKRDDDLDLIARARELGYTIVYTRDELLSIPPGTTRLLGLFASEDTFNDKPEEELRATNTPMYVPTAPTVGEMLAVALPILSADNARFLVVCEEEGSDNFGGANNASGMFEALRRADQAIAVARRFVQSTPNALVLTTCDSDCAGLQVIGEPDLDPDKPLPERDEENGSAIDGRDGTGTLPFIAKPDRQGRSLPFGVAWASGDDVSGAIALRAEGFQSELVRGSADNTFVFALMHRVLFGDTPR